MLVTNFHVIQGGDAARVRWQTNRPGKPTSSAAFPIGPRRADHRRSSVASDAHHRRRLQRLQVGQKVFAIGNPFGLDKSLTTGVISAVGREIESVTRRPIKNMIQTDAAINPGNSGGPLLDSTGRIIGVNTAIYSPSGAYAGIGFAIPVDEVNRVVPQLIRHGKIIRPGMGVQVAPDQVTNSSD